MPNDTLSADIICPYYQYHNKLCITCERAGGGTVSQTFTDQERMDKHTDRRCKSEYKKCFVAAVSEFWYTKHDIQPQRYRPVKVDPKPDQVSFFDGEGA